MGINYVPTSIAKEKPEVEGEDTKGMLNDKLVLEVVGILKDGLKSKQGCRKGKWWT